MATTPKVLIVDGTNLLLRAHYARNKRGAGPGLGLSTRDGRDSTALYGAISTFARQVRRIRPTHAVWAFDRGASRARVTLDHGYKSNRPVSHAGAPHTSSVQEFLSLLGVTVLQRVGLEADDIMAAAAQQLTEEGASVVILTTDHDLRQLVSPSVTVITPSIGPTKERVFDVEEVEREYGVSPRQLPELWALQGDPGDGIAGVPGIGPSRARKILNDYGTLWNALEVPEGKLVDHEERIRLNYRLISLLEPPPIPLRLDDCTFQPRHTRDLYWFLQHWEMDTFIRRIGEGTMWEEPREGDDVVPRSARERVPV